ncbi:MAG: Cyclic di-GMP phosphodiesterase response regulator RpfG [bacterium ADurb.Bin363]|nr:MAG: Cyclic di-GMP phosphodiesterase response regulator RpfG [bacterium ADurb.Bin363]
MRLDLDFADVINKLITLLEGLTGGDIFFVLKNNYVERHYYTKNGIWKKIHFIKQILKENKYRKLNHMLKEYPVYYPFLLKGNYCYIIPIIIKNSLKGYTFIVREKTREFKEQEIEVINNILSQAGVVIENSFLIEETHAMNFEIVKSLVKAIEAKDTYTKGHSQRVAAISNLIAKEMGFTPQTMKKIDMAAVLHDVGKIGISEKILNKVERLTEEEYNQIRKHPENGYEIVSQIKNMLQIAEIIKYHHEKWDGTGYPEKLEGEFIPIESRIISVADTFDAITSDRSYRKGASIEKAYEEIMINIGKQFDPFVVKNFLNIEREKIIKIIKI